MNKQKPQTLKGFRDFLPEQMKIRNQVIKTFVSVFEDFGFEPLETPALEYAEVLLGKYGAEADKLVYTFKDKGKRQVGLRYDLTVPTSRVLAQYQNELKLPFKRYQIQPVWRAEKPQKSRYREFTQCDVDTFGVNSVLADAEIIAVIYQALKKLGFEKFTIKINSRQVLFSLLEKLGVKNQGQQFLILQIIDKLEKIGKTGAEQELLTKGFDKDFISRAFKVLAEAGPDKDLSQLFGFLNDFEVDKNYYQFTPFLVRGLDYYTGPIFETYVEKPKIGSITGGGRYDNLINQLGGPEIPATGTTIGLDRICDVIEETGLWKQKIKEQSKVLITIFDNNFVNESIKLFSWLKQKKINVLLYPNPEDSLAKQIKYADNKKIPAIVILGSEEIKDNCVSVRWLESGKQEKVKKNDLIKKFTPH
ncbi:MAG: histidine--tRNA ligase [Patescibacteria group bacterium]